MKAIGTAAGVPMGENSRLLPREPSETPNQNPYKITHFVQGILSLAAFGYCMKESITEGTVIAIVGAAASSVSTIGAALGLWNAVQCQRAFKMNLQQEVRDFSNSGLVNVTEDEHEETSGKKET